MDKPRIVTAGIGFGEVRRYVLDVLPDVQFDMVKRSVLRREGAEADVLIPAMARVDAELMDRIRGLRLIHQWGAGLEGVDIAAATARGIAVANVPTAGTGNAESVAEWCVMAAIAASRRLPLAMQLIRAGKSWGEPAGRSLMGRTAGIVGLGGIGQALALRLRPFGMRLIGVKRSADAALAQQLGMDWIGGRERLPELLRLSDYLFLCLPLTADSRHLIDAPALALLPAQACIVNAGRGGLIDQPALEAALAEGRFIGAGLDVYEQEPLDPASPLLERIDVIATPHIGGVTDASYRGIAERVAANVRRLMAGEALVNCVNGRELSKAGTRD